MCTLRRKDRAISGMITLELAIILPAMIIWVVWLVFLMMFFMDMSVLKSEVIRLSDEASFAWNKGAEADTGRYVIGGTKDSSRGLLYGKDESVPVKEVSARLKKRLRERLILTDCSDIRVREDHWKITVQGVLGFRWPFPGIRAAGTHGLQFTGKGASPVNDWEQWLWIVSASQEAGGSK